MSSKIDLLSIPASSSYEHSVVENTLGALNELDSPVVRYFVIGSLIRVLHKEKEHISQEFNDPLTEAS